MYVPSVVIKVAKELEKHGGEAYFSGGFPHDIIYNRYYPNDTRNNNDYDIECYNLSFDQLKDILSPFGRVSLDGKEFSVINLYADEEEIQVSLPMGKETKLQAQELLEHIINDGKLDEHHLIKRNPDPHLDKYIACSRREHTNKSMLMRILTKDLYDPFKAEEHIKDRTFDVIRIPDGKGPKRTFHAFVIDPVRVLRAAVYRSRYDMTPSKDIIKYSKLMSDSFHSLTKDRVFKEWIKIFGYPNPSLALEFLDEVNWLRHFPYVWAMKFVIQDPGWHPEGNLFNHVMIAIDYGEQLCNRLQISGRRKEAIVHGILLHDIGKLTKTAFVDGRVRSRGHNTSGEEIIREIFDLYGCGHNMFLDAALDACIEHMICYTVKQPGSNLKKLIRRYYTRRRELSLDELGIVAESDRIATLPDKPGMPEEFEQLLQTEQEMIDESGNLRKPLVTGQYVMEWLDVSPGPEVGKVKQAASDAEADGVFLTLEDAKVWVTKTYGRETTQ